MKKIILVIILAISSLQFMSCSKSADSATPAATVTWSTSVNMSTKFEVPAIANRTETATATLELYSDNTLKYNIVVSGLASGDALAAAHIHLGNAGVSGAVYIPLAGTFAGSTISGTATLTAGQADTLKTQETYVNVHTTQVAGGLIRGQVDSKVVYAADIVMNGANEVPAVTTTATGVAILRLTEDKKLYVKITISNLEAGDALSAAHIHAGTATVSGAVVLGLYSSATEFGTAKKFTVDNAFYTSLLNDALYVNAHSTARASGIVRGQIR